MERILFIGNSFTYYNDMPGIFAAIASAAGIEVEVDSVTKGGWTLEKFASTSDPYGKQADEAIRAEKRYDVVVLQDQSKTPAARFETFKKGALALAKKIADEQPQARLCFYSTWGYADEFVDEELSALGMAKTEELCAHLRAAYESVADDLFALVAYVGDAFLEVYRKTDVDPYAEDRKHPSYAGSYLAACVHFFTLFPETVREDVRDFGTLEPDVARRLIDVAYRVSRDLLFLLENEKEHQTANAV